MAKTNYSYEKRQRELAKKKKKDEKRLKKGRDDDVPQRDDGNNNATDPASAEATGTEPGSQASAGDSPQQ